jgi:hypothetical protein
MSNTNTLSLQLYQVLEEEYLNLHGALSPINSVSVNGRKGIVPALDWDFHAGHIKKPEKLARRLKRGSDAAKDMLPEHLHQHVKRFVQRLEQYEKSEPKDATILESALNELLKVHFYNAEAFKYVDLKNSTRELLKSYAKVEDGSDDLAFINRLLLEEAFPDELETVSDIRLGAMFQRLHGERQAALCLSGGGIRSGTFSLGILQGLAHFNLLKEFDYLSTVSGGGYIGSWLTAWLNRHPRGLAGVTADLSNSAPTSKIDPDPLTIRYLRDYSNFITPKVGLLTADTWAFIAIYLRNLFLNWLVLLPLVMVLLALPRLNVSLLLSQDKQQYLTIWPFSFISPMFNVRHLFLLGGSMLLVMALAYISISRPAVSEQLIERSPFWRDRRRQRSFLWWCLLPMVGAAFCLTTYWAWSSEAHSEIHDKSSRLIYFVLFGLAIPIISSLISGYILKRHRHLKEFRKLEGVVMFILLAVGGFGGGLLWYASQNNQKLSHPVEPIINGSWATEWYACIAVPVLLSLILLATTLFVGLTSRGYAGRAELLNDEDREWWARFSAWSLIALLAWLLFSLLSIHGPRLFFAAPGWIASIGGLSGLGSLLAGFSAKTPSHEESTSGTGLVQSIIREQVLPILALVFLLTFLILMSLLISAILRGGAYAVGDALSNYSLQGYSLRPLKDYGDIISQPVDQRSGGVAHLSIIHRAALWYNSAFILFMAAVSFGLATRINLNKFSLHGGYRNRLIRAFLGASRDKNERKPNPFTGFDPSDNMQMHELRPGLFHQGDFEDLEGLALKIQAADDPTSKFIKSRLAPDTREDLQNFTGTTRLPLRLRISLITDLNSILESGEVAPVTSAPGQPALAAGQAALAAGQATLVKTRAASHAPQTDQQILRKRAVLQSAYPTEISKKYPPSHKLLHIINTSLNLVGGENLAWQQRKAEPFVITPLHAGCYRIGYRRSTDYGGERGISLGTAATISGAAASSNMGYYTTSPVLSMVLTLFNVRLGWWLGNPGPAGAKTYRRESPSLSLLPVAQEAFGMTDDTNKYVYLTDGGHFENLSFYEMVLRRCRLIVVCDGVEDSDYQLSDLGNAVRKIRIDLGIPIHFDEVLIMKEKPKGGQPDARHTYWAFGRIEYWRVDGDVQDGILLYIKPAVYGDDEPRDILQYKKANKDFPHQSTGDQFFDEPQFESYRMLGWHIMNLICKNDFDRLQGKPKPSRNLNLSQFVWAAFNNYTGNSPDNPTGKNLPKGLEDLLNDSDWLSKHDTTADA